jgi:hypothetical protein
MRCCPVRKQIVEYRTAGVAVYYVFGRMLGRSFDASGASFRSSRVAL